jgi:hypothetical protein
MLAAAVRLCLLRTSADGEGPNVREGAEQLVWVYAGLRPPRRATSA